MVELTFFGGVTEIGGNKILLMDNGTCVFLDFGFSFRIRDLYYEEYLKARGFSTINEHVSFGQLPTLKGLYRTDHLQHADPNHKLLGRDDEKAVEAVLISHGHMDHVGLIPYLRPDIQLLGSELTRRYLHFLQETKKDIEREYLDWYPAFHFEPGSKTKKSRSAKSKQSRDYKVLDPMKSRTLGDLEIVAYPVDHSLQGATSYIIKTSSGNIAYTGDIRFHGCLQEASNNYLKVLEATDIKVLLCEGTHAKRSTEITEAELQVELTSNIADVKGLVLGNYSQFDACRIYTLSKAASACNRKLLVNPKQAYYISLIDGVINAITPSKDDFGVIIPRMGNGVWGDSRFDKEIWKSDYRWRFKDEIFDRSDLVTPQEVAGEPEKYVVTCSFFELNLLHDLKPPEGSVFLWSRSMPYDVEDELQLDRVRHWLKHFGISELIEGHCSGHMPGDDIQKFVDAAQPEILVPIHTKTPELFKGWHDDVRIMNYTETLQI